MSIIINFMIADIDFKAKTSEMKLAFYKENEPNIPLLILSEKDFNSAFISFQEAKNSLNNLLSSYVMWNTKLGIIKFEKKIKARIIHILNSKKQWMYNKVGEIAGLEDGLLFLEVTDDFELVHTINSSECLFDIITKESE